MIKRTAAKMAQEHAMLRKQIVATLQQHQPMNSRQLFDAMGLQIKGGHRARALLAIRYLKEHGAIGAHPEDKKARYARWIVLRPAWTEPPPAETSSPTSSPKQPATRPTSKSSVEVELVRCVLPITAAVDDCLMIYNDMCIGVRKSTPNRSPMPPAKALPMIAYEASPKSSTNGASLEHKPKSTIEELTTYLRKQQGRAVAVTDMQKQLKYHYTTLYANLNRMANDKRVIKEGRLWKLAPDH